MTIACKQTFKAYSDAGHGWVAVKRWMINQLDIADEITRFSYQRGKTVYLEEDQDAYTFIKAYQAVTGFPPRFIEGKHCDTSPIRSYDRYAKNTSNHVA